MYNILIGIGWLPIVLVCIWFILREAHKTTRGMVWKVALYAVGFLLIYELFLVVQAIAQKLL